MLSQATGYATIALGFVAAAGGRPVLVKHIAEACDIPAPYLAKIINGLARAGLVLTQRGIGGGVTLARDATSLTLIDVCRALDDPILEQRCMLGVAVCSDERACPAHAFNTECRSKLMDFLSSHSVADIAAFESKRRWNMASSLGIDGGSRVAAGLVAMAMSGASGGGGAGPGVVTHTVGGRPSGSGGTGGVRGAGQAHDPA